MKSIQVHSLPLKEVVGDIANTLETNYSEYCEESVVSLPDRIGEGVIQGINFEGKPEQQEIFQDVNASRAFYHDGFYSFQRADLFQELQAYGQDLFLR